MKTKTKKRKYDLGSYVGNLKVPTLAPKLSNELAPAPKMPSSNTPGIGGAMDIVGSATDMTSELLSGIGQNAIDNADPRSNPATAMKKANTMNTAGDILKGAGKGAAMGAVAGPWGAVIGGAAGALVSGIGKIVGAKKQRADLAKAQTGWSSSNLDSYSNAMSKSNYVKGGTIKGPGTGKSDSINMKAKNGAFIVPSENADYGRQLGEEYLGWKPGEKANKKEGGVAIKASNSEVIFNPEEVRILQYHGINLDSLAPKADVSQAKADGGSLAKTRKKPGGSNVGKKKFADGSKRHGPYAGTSGGAPKGSYPIPDKKHALAALRLAHHAPNPAGIRAKVHSKYPGLGKGKAEGGPVDISNLKTGLGKRSNKLAPAPYKIEKAPPDPNATFQVTQNFKTPLTDINVADKMVELGYHNDRNALLSMTPEERQALIPADSPLSYEKVKSGTANQGEYKYYLNDKKPAKNNSMYKADGGSVTPQDSTKMNYSIDQIRAVKKANYQKWPSPDVTLHEMAGLLNDPNYGEFAGTPTADTLNHLAQKGDTTNFMKYVDYLGKHAYDTPAPDGRPFPPEAYDGTLHMAKNKQKKADGGPVANPLKEKPSMKGALVNYMNNPKSTGATMTTSDPNNVPVTQKQRNGANMDKFLNDPKNMQNIMAMGSMSGTISGSTGLFNKAQAIEEIVNSPRMARLGKAAQDWFREIAPGMSKEEFQPHADNAGLNNLGKYFTYGEVAKSTGYKKGGKIMKKKNMMKGLSTGMKGKKKMPIPADVDTSIMMKKGGSVSKEKAREIMHDGTAHGKPLTKKQKGFFGVHAFGKPKFAPGGPVVDPITRESAITPVKLFKPKVSTFKVQDKPASTLKPLKPKSPANELPNIGLPEIAGAIQAAGGAYGLATAKRAPDIGVSDTLRNLSSDVRKQAAYGLEPDQLNVLNNSIERSRRDTNRFITESGGSGQEVMSKLNTSLGTTIAGKENVAFQDAAEKARKFSNVIGVDTQLAGQEFDVKKMRREDWYKNQDMFASLLSTGIENIIGARQFKAQQKTLSEIDNRPVFNFK